MKRQTTNTVLMVRPATFRANEQTLSDNFFQKKGEEGNAINTLAQKEFDDLVLTLRNAGVEILVYQDTIEPETPDALFPNNWLSFHSCGTLVLYPMYAQNRRWERQENIISFVEECGFEITSVLDYTSAENEEVFLEGTGSMILDRVNQKAYCALSNRSNEDLFIEFCEDMEFLPIVFRANQGVNNKRLPIYHTNVMMSIAEKFAIVCLQSIDSSKERKLLVSQLEESGKEVIPISEKQMYHFVGNVLEIKGEDGGVLAMSTTAYNSFSPEQKRQISNYVTLAHSPIPTIETHGGGGVRCMIAEVFSPKKK